MNTSIKLSLRYACIAFALAATPAAAVPLLQFYAEGSTYDSSLESWVLSGSPGDTIRIWAIGNVAGPGSSSNKNPGGVIKDVHLLVSFNGTPTPFTLRGTKVGGTGSFGGFTDSSVPSDASPTGGLHAGDDIPLLFPTANPSLENHQAGRLDGPGPRYFYDFALGDFTRTDSQLTDFNGSTDSPGATDCITVTCAQINAYDFTVPVGSIRDWHFDLVGYAGKNGARGSLLPDFIVAPFSHDGDGVAVEVKVSEPAQLLLFGIGLVAAGWVRRKHVH